MAHALKEIFATLEGEGAQSGREGTLEAPRMAGLDPRQPGGRGRAPATQRLGALDFPFFDPADGWSGPGSESCVLPFAHEPARAARGETPASSAAFDGDLLDMSITDTDQRLAA